MYYTNNTATSFTNSNVAVGYRALYGSNVAANNTGNDNTAVGYEALNSNTSGNNNTAIGSQTLFINTSGSDNAAMGRDALQQNTTGNYNVANGEYALLLNTTGSSNSAIGFDAGQINNTGSRNVFLGDSAGISNTTGYNNTYVGYYANGSAALTNAAAIGYFASVTSSNSMVLGGTGANAVNVGMGTTSPTGKLEVVTDGSLLGGMRVTNTGATVGPTIYFNGQSKAFTITATNSSSGAGANKLVFRDYSLATDRMAIDGSGNVGIGTDFPSALLNLNDGHIRSQQTTAPTIAVTVQNGITAAAITAGSTDTKGNITTTGTQNATSPTVLTITFNKVYNVAPIVVITAANLTGGVCPYYVSATTTNFTLSFQGSAPAATPSFNYMVIE